MKVLIDTNVILDVLTGRKPHVDASADFLRLCGTHIAGFITASQTTDIFCLLRRGGKSISETKSFIRKLTDNIRVMDVTASDVKNALESGMDDYEDALLAFNGERHKAQFIVTRNEKDFDESPIPAITPQMFMAQLYSG